jgi:FAD:protein FMN transferase
MTTRRNVMFGFGALAVGVAAWRGVTVSRAGTAFGTTVNLTVTARTGFAANSAIDAGFAEIRAVHRAASLFDPGSEISRLNAAGRLEQPSLILSEIVEASDVVYRVSGGAFDPSIQPLWALWSKGVPNADDLTQALQRVGWDKLTSSPQELSLHSGAALSFNGIAQGYAADRVIAALRGAGALSAVVDTGEAGRLNAEGAVLIKHPRTDGALGSIALRNGFVAVSGDYATAFTDDFVNHHIFDPRLGFSPRELASVAVVAPTGAMADGLATAFMVMGVAESMACMNKVQGCSALFVDKAGEVTASTGMKSLFQNT